MERKSIAIDMDEVLADTFKKILKTANDLFNLSIDKEDVRGNKFWNLLNEEQVVELRKAINAPGFFRDLEVIDSAIPVVKELSEHYDIYIATAAMEVPNSFIDKYNWLKEHFPFLNSSYFIFCGNKKVVNADYLIDDTVKQLDAFTGEGILFKTIFNENLQTNHVQVDNWKEVLEYFNSLRISV
ncbi:5' nucleotidase, NT5C type [Oceanobacillus salinisoli]|uniref:5' nucleotidase, NT5C type n=1 Tax=Oceanobacillus salinisoli TaxID=2678611 RepID=UPI0012E23878|nr:5'(3')-deoxyribonucleotidase [Oceanobacillus salinisoli]